MDRWFDGSKVRWFDGWVESSIDRWFDGSLVRWIVVGSYTEAKLLIMAMGVTSVVGSYTEAKLLIMAMGMTSVVGSYTEVKPKWLSWKIAFVPRR